MGVQDEEAIRSLDELADVATSVADEQRRIANQARRIARDRRSGATWKQIVDKGAPRALFELVREGATRMSRMASDLRVAFARGLSGEGLTTRQIAERFGVSHQRVSSLLSKNGP